MNKFLKHLMDPKAIARATIGSILTGIGVYLMTIDDLKDTRGLSEKSEDEEET